MILGEHEGELPGEWPPCKGDWSSSCGCRQAFARAVPEHRNIGAYCSKGHLRKWSDGDVEGHWIPHGKFLAGGEYEGVLPEWIFPDAHAGRGKRPYDIPENRKRLVRLQQQTCAICDTPPFKNYQDSVALLAWLAAYRTALFLRVRHYLNTIGTYDAEMWQLKLAPEFQFEVRKAVQDSHLQIDHGIPADRLEEIWAALKTKIRTFARNGPIFALCRECNNGRGGARWAALNDLCDAAYPASKPASI
jgi:hypothetical protein